VRLRRSGYGRPLWLLRAVLLLFPIAPSFTSAKADEIPPCAILPYESQNPTTTWSRLDNHEGILASGDQIVALLEFSESNVSLLSRDAEKRPLQTVALPDDATAVLRIYDATIPLGDGCSLILTTNAHASSDPQLLVQAEALKLDHSATKAAARGDIEVAAREMQRAFSMLLTSPHPSPSAVAIFASTAIERLLDIGDARAAEEIFTSLRRFQYEDSAPPEGVSLLIDLARARLLSFEDNPSASLELRESIRSRLGAVFQESSSRFLWNELRIANLLLQVGQRNRARQFLSQPTLTRLTSTAPLTPLTIAIRTANANLAALEGQELESLLQTSSLFTQVRLEYGSADPRTIDIENQLGRAQLRHGQTEEALTSISHVFLWRQGRSPPLDQKLLESELLLSRLYNELGRLDTAYALLLPILDNLDAAPEPPLESLRLQALAGLASVQASKGDLQQSEQTWATVVDLYAKFKELHADEYFAAIFNYSLVSILNGHVEQVCLNWTPQLSSSLFRGTLDPHSSSFNSVLLGLCEGYSAQSEAVDAALNHIESGRRALQSLDGIDSESSLYCLTLLAAVAIHGHKQTAAVAYLRELVYEVESSRHRIGLDRKMRAFWLSKWIKESTTSIGYISFARLLAESGDFEQAIAISELSRNRLLRDISLDPASTASDPDFDNSRSNDSPIRKLDEELSRTSEVVRRVEIECERQELLRSSIKGMDQAKLPEKIDKTRIELQPRVEIERIPARTAIVSIHHSDGEWWAIVITRNSGSHFVRLPGGDDLGVVASALLEARDANERKAWRMKDGRLVLSLIRPSIGAQGPLSRQEVEQILVARLWIPLRSYFQDCREIGVIADDELQRLPLGSLRVGTAFLIDQFAFVYGFSISSLLTKLSATTSTSWEFDFLGVSDDSYFKSKEREANTPYEVGFFRPTFDAGEDRIPIGRQFARKEILLISDVFRHKRTTTLFGEEGGRELLLSADRNGSLQRYRFVHLAGHFTTSTSFLKEPVIGIGSGVTATELSHFTMTSDVVVLSGCNSAIGPALSGQGMLSLGFAALAAGSRAAMLTISRVPSDMSGSFMSEFYRNAMENVGAAMALAKVQRKFAHSKDSRRRDPATWGAYIVVE
jgi:CHAT domain-containing protein